MEKRYQHTVNGQSVLEDDLNVLGDSSSLADDRVFAELFRMSPYDGATVRRGILPHGHVLNASAATVAPHGATGSVIVNPFRAFVGSRTAVATDAKKNWRDTRSALGVGTSTLEQVVAISANASGNPRWDLVYAAISVDAPDASVTRKVKDPTSKAITGTVLVTTLQTTVAINVVPGTPGATPAFPALPTDSGSTYYIPLAFVRVPTGFGASSIVAKKDINETAPVLTLSRASGASTLRPADQHNVPGGTAISGAGTSTGNGVLAWTGAAGTRPAAYLPPSMVGCESLIVAIDAGNASNANWSHQSGQVVDASRDWRNRIWRWNAAVGREGSSVSAFFWTSSTAGLLNPCVPGAPTAPMPGYAAAADSPTFASGMGGSNNIAGTPATIAMVCALGAGSVAAPANNANIGTFAMAPGTAIYLFADITTGFLKVAIVGAPLASVIFWLDASAPYPNL